MHDIQPYYSWHDRYASEADRLSPFYGRVYSEFTYTNKIYNYFLHPQWDDFGSQTLYAKQIWADYSLGYTIVELIGEWNDLLYNDIKFLKEEVVDAMLEAGISKFIIVCENVLNFHGDDNCYYEEWAQEAAESDGWIAMINTLPHVDEELHDAMVDLYVFFGDRFSELPWRPKKPKDIFRLVSELISKTPAKLG